MPIDPPRQQPEPIAQPLDAGRERARILASVRGKQLETHQAEMLCASLAMLAELEADEQP